jgi:hypothetical protein
MRFDIAERSLIEVKRKEKAGSLKVDEIDRMRRRNV